MIFRVLVYLVLCVLAYSLGRWIVRGIIAPRKETSGQPRAEELVQDPHCQTYIPKGSALKRRINGKNYYFCNRECLEGFLQKQP